MSTVLTNRYSTELIGEGYETESNRFEEHEHGFCHEECKKKHGLVCRILTRLHLKHRGQDRQKLLSEDREVSNHSYEKTQKSSKKLKKKNSKKYSLHVDEDIDEKFDTISNKGRADVDSDNNNEKRPVLNQRGSSKYTPLCNEDETEESGESPNSPSSRFQHRIVIIDNEDDGAAIKEPQDIHIYGDAHFGEVFHTDPEGSPLIEKVAQEKRSTGEYVKHKWQGKRAIKARKRIRRVMKATWVSLQTSLNVNYVPNVNSLASVLVIQPNRR